MREIERRHVPLLCKIGDDRRAAGGKRAEPRARCFASRRPAQVDAHVRRGDGLVEFLVRRTRDERRHVSQPKFGDDRIQVEHGIATADKDQTRVWRARTDGRKRAQDFRHTTLRRESTEHADDGRILGQRMCRAKSPVRFINVDGGVAFAKRDVFDRTSWKRFSDHVERASCMHGDEPRGVDDRAQHRPVVVVRTAESRHGEFREIARHVRMIPREFLAIRSRLFARQQRVRACMMQPRFMQHDQARPPKEIRPDEFVRPGIADLIDDQIELPAQLAPDEIVRTLHAHFARRGPVVRRSRHRRAMMVNEDINAMPARGQHRHVLRRTAGDTARIGRPGGEPGKLHQVSLIPL